MYLMARPPQYYFFKEAQKDCTTIFFTLLYITNAHKDFYIIDTSFDFIPPWWSKYSPTMGSFEMFVQKLVFIVLM